LEKNMKTVLAVIVGLVIGSAVNMGLIMLGGELIPPPDGVVPMDMDSLKASMHLFQPQHFLFPFLAHALGTLVAAIVAIKISPTDSTKAAYIVAGLFMLGGIANAFMLPAPMWFIALDIIAAYLPMGWIALKIAAKSKTESQPTA
jgi:hypothetical protein